jgi:hypothetical protein
VRFESPGYEAAAVLVRTEPLEVVQAGPDWHSKSIFFS